MSWNEPGGRNNDPWGGGGRGGGNQGPPDLDEALRNLGRKLNTLFGGGGPSRNDEGTRGVASIIMVVLLLIYVFAGVYKVEQAEEAVILRFGKFLNVEGPGLNWRWPLVDTVNIVNTAAVDKETVRAMMISKDVNFVDVELEIQYRVTDPRNYVLRVTSAEEILLHATESALRHVAGGTMMEQLISKGRAALAGEVMPRLQGYLDKYETGLLVLQVNVVEALPPEEVRAAFVDVNKAPKDKERMENEARAYANQVVPEARGKAQRLIEEARAYKESVVARAEGDAMRFNQLYAEYRRAPEVTRKRLYLETMEEVIGRSKKVLVDVEGGNNLLYLPLDKLSSPGSATAPALPSVTPTTAAPAQESTRESSSQYGNWRDRLRGGTQ